MQEPHDTGRNVVLHALPGGHAVRGRPELLTGLVTISTSVYLSVEMIGRMAQGCRGKGQPNPTKGHVRNHGNTRGATEQVMIRPSLAVANARALPLAIVVRRVSSASPEPNSATLGTHLTTKISARSTQFIPMGNEACMYVVRRKNPCWRSYQMSRKTLLYSMLEPGTWT